MSLKRIRTNELSNDACCLVSRKAGREAFTLVELLAVVAMIAILAALTAAALSKAKERADGVRCAGNQRQIGVALALHLSDSDSYPHFLGHGSDGRVWPELFEAYLGAKWPLTDETGRSFNNGLYVCPGYNRIRGVYFYEKGQNNGAAFIAGSYAYNEFGISWHTWTGLGGVAHSIDGPVKESMVVNPSGMIAFGDSVPMSYGGPGDGRVYGQQDLGQGMWHSLGRIAATPAYVRNAIARRHSDRWITLFADGHIERPRTDDLFDRSNPNCLRRWNRDSVPHEELLRPL